MLEYLFFKCIYARILIGWVYFNLMVVHPAAAPFTVEELLFGINHQRRFEGKKAGILILTSFP
jgi:hypothetical protein